jgi:hypothetical protein
MEQGNAGAREEASTLKVILAPFLSITNAGKPTIYKSNIGGKMFLRIGVFVALAYFFLLLLAVIQQATGLLPQDIGLPHWGSGSAALLMLVLFRKDGFKILVSAWCWQAFSISSSDFLICFTSISFTRHP